MGNLKRFLAMTLTMLMVVGCFAISTSVAAFDDVVDYQQQINLMTLLNIIQGYDEDEFGPDDDVLRWHMALWVAKIMTGKTDDAYVNWYSTDNYTNFQDINQDQFIGSISYCNENSVVIGTSAITFEPDNGIMIQDVFTMVVRMLGYGSATMDAQYPWSFIDKAIALNLDEGLAEDYGNEDVATREQAAVILYNALFAPKKDGTTYAEAQFNLTFSTVVITTTSKTANMFPETSAEKITKEIAGETYVGFNILNADGNIATGTNATYYLPKSNFGYGEDLDENLFLGQSFKVVTNNNYETLLYCEAVEPVYLSQEDFYGVKEASSSKAEDGRTIYIEKEKYNAVSAYTRLNNAQNTKTTNDYEIIVYNSTGTYTNEGTGSYIYDEAGNILIKDATGKYVIYMQYYPNAIGGSKYLLKIADDQFVDPTDEDWAKAARYGATEVTGFVKMDGKAWTSYKLYAEGAYTDTALYDDNGDGIYDRAFVTIYKFGFIDFDGDKYFRINGAKVTGNTLYTSANLTYVDADGNVIKAEDLFTPVDKDATTNGNYVLYSWNPQTKYLTVKEILVPQRGLITGVNYEGGKIEFDRAYYEIHYGNISDLVYTIGNSRLVGAIKSEAMSSVGKNNLDGKNVWYIVKDKMVLKVWGAAQAATGAGATHFVYDRTVGYTTTGYMVALGYKQSTTKSAITLATLDGAWYAINNGVLVGNVVALNTGDLLTVTTDSLGNYHGIRITDDQYQYHFHRDINKIIKNGYKYNDKVTSKTKFFVAVKFENGVAIPQFRWDEQEGVFDYYFFENSNGTSIIFDQFKANADSIFVVKDRNGELKSAKGIPSDNSYIQLYDTEYDKNADTLDEARIYVAVDGDGILKFMYVDNAEFKGTFSGSSWGENNNDYIIYVDSAAKATQTSTNQYTDGKTVLAGTTYTYSKVLNMTTGDQISVSSINQILQAGGFYKVVGGFVDSKVTIGEEVKVGDLYRVELYQATLLNTSTGKVVDTQYNTNKVYELTSSTSTLTRNADGSLANKRAAINTEITAHADYYVSVYYVADSRYQGSGSNVFVYTGTVLTGKAPVTGGNNFEAKGPYQYVTVDGAYDSLIWGNMFKANKFYWGATVTTPAKFNFYEISKEAYLALSTAARISNANFNEVFANLGTAMYLTDATGKKLEESDFNYKNVLAFTMIGNTTVEGDKYFFVMTTKPGAIDPGTVSTSATTYLKWVNNNDSADSYTLKLGTVNLLSTGYALIGTAGLVDVDGNDLSWRDVLAERPVLNIYANLINSKDPANMFFNYETEGLKLYRDRALTKVADIFDLGKKAQALIAKSGQELFVKVPVVEAEDGKYVVESVKYLALNNLIEWSYDGTNGLWDKFFFGDHIEDWHGVPNWISATPSNSLHPDEYSVYKIIMPANTSIITYVTYKFIPNYVPEPIDAIITTDIVDTGAEIMGLSGLFNTSLTNVTTDTGWLISSTELNDDNNIKYPAIYEALYEGNTISLTYNLAEGNSKLLVTTGVSYNDFGYKSLTFTMFDGTTQIGDSQTVTTPTTGTVTFTIPDEVTGTIEIKVTGVKNDTIKLYSLFTNTDGDVVVANVVVGSVALTDEDTTLQSVAVTADSVLEDLIATISGATLDGNATEYYLNYVDGTYYLGLWTDAVTFSTFEAWVLNETGTATLIDDVKLINKTVEATSGGNFEYYEIDGLENYANGSLILIVDVIPVGQP